jgi:hypothetical protein
LHPDATRLHHRTREVAWKHRTLKRFVVEVVGLSEVENRAGVAGVTSVLGFEKNFVTQPPFFAVALICLCRVHNDVSGRVGRKEFSGRRHVHAGGVRIVCDRALHHQGV